MTTPPRRIAAMLMVLLMLGMYKIHLLFQQINLQLSHYLN